MGDNTDTSVYLRRGDVLVTKTKGHTAIVLTDGEYGAETKAALLAFQKDKGIPETGVIDEATLAALYGGTVEVTGATVYVRSAPMGAILGVVKAGEALTYQGEDRDGWHLVIYRGQNAWISGRYSTVRK